jgi:hypothetical protein
MQTGRSNNSDSIKRKHVHFLEGKHAFINIDKSIVEILNLNDSDSFTEEISSDGNGILLRRQGKLDI